MRNYVAMLLIAGVLAGCSRKHVNDGFDQDAESSLHVENHHWGDVDIYVVHDGQRSRLGTVTATTEQNFSLTSGLIGHSGTLQFLAHAVGMPGSLNSETIAIRPGGMQVNWVIESNMSRAVLSIY
jgi:hypothetical protein